MEPMKMQLQEQLTQDGSSIFAPLYQEARKGKKQMNAGMGYGEFISDHSHFSIKYN
jgi:hypothetical protein